jgi:hypothetical protein
MLFIIKNFSYFVYTILHTSGTSINTTRGFLARGTTHSLGDPFGSFWLHHIRVRSSELPFFVENYYIKRQKGHFVDDFQEVRQPTPK